MPAWPRGLQHVEAPGPTLFWLARPTANSMTMTGRPRMTRNTQVHEHEGRPAVLAGDVGEAPHVAQADGAAGLK